MHGTGLESHVERIKSILEKRIIKDRRLCWLYVLSENIKTGEERRKRV